MKVTSSLKFPFLKNLKIIFLAFVICRFSADRRIFLVGYGVYGSIHGPAEYDAIIELIHTASGKVIATNSTSFSCDGSDYTYRLMFKEPVEILPNTIYTASAKFDVRMIILLFNIILLLLLIY